jgi:phosphonoacetaldehyde hydrolase
MGLAKKDHLRELFRLPTVAAQWQQVHQRDWTEGDVVELYENHFRPLQVELAPKHSRLVPGLLDCVAELRRRGLKIGTTTGYFREAAELVFQAARDQGYHPDCNVIPDDVSVGRPQPWMIFRIMETLGVYPPSTVVKVGDTVFDIEEGRNAGVWSIGVLRTSSEIGLTEEELASTPAETLQPAIEAVRRKLLAAGAHDTIDSIAELPAWLDRQSALTV